MKRTLPTRHAALVLLSLSGCLSLVDKDLGEVASTDTGGESSGASGSSGDGMTSNATSPDTGGSETGDGDGCTPDAPMDCESDPERDGFGYACDNAADHFNPDQSDIDGDGIGDVIDLCPTVAGSNNTADSDSDGIGNACDSCRHDLNFYNDAGSMPAWQQVRSIPDTGDFDGDGIGDACDNCVVIPNCEAYDLDNPWAPGDPIASDDPNLCQRDDDQDMIGDACAGMQIEGAAGAVGFGDDDDFDQDGLTNALDGCMRLPMFPIACTGDENCPQSSHCETTTGICNHVDTDSDAVGDACDTCVFAPNGDQLLDGGSVDDDDDGDFVGQVCENGPSVINPLPMAFYSESSAGVCCTRRLVEEAGTLDLIDQHTGVALRDPDGLPIRWECNEAEDPELRTCRRLPSALEGQPGLLILPPGCAGEGVELVLDDVGGDPAALWRQRCELPQLDQDFDGIGDDADLCPFAFDPENLPYVDGSGTVWEDDGRYCNGEYSLDAICGG